MNTVFKYNDKINECISNILSYTSGKTYICIDNIDIEEVNYLKEIINNNENLTILISVSNKTITRTVLDELYNINESIYFFNNNNTSNTINNNIIMHVDDNIIEVVFVIPNFERETLEKSNNISIHIFGSFEDEELKKLFDEINSRVVRYTKITKDIINELEEIKDLRNDKASKITSLASRDEIRKSFRKINEVEDSEAFIKMIEMNSEIKYKGDDVLMSDSDINTKISANKTEEIEIDLGE